MPIPKRHKRKPHNAKHALEDALPDFHKGVDLRLLAALDNAAVRHFKERFTTSCWDLSPFNLEKLIFYQEDTINLKDLLVFSGLSSMTFGFFEQYEKAIFLKLLKRGAKGWQTRCNNQQYYIRLIDIPRLFSLNELSDWYSVCPFRLERVRNELTIAQIVDSGDEPSISSQVILSLELGTVPLAQILHHYAPTLTLWYSAEIYNNYLLWLKSKPH